MFENHVESFLIEEFERREDLAEVLSGFGEDFLNEFERGNGEDCDVNCLKKGNT